MPRCYSLASPELMFVGMGCSRGDKLPIVRKVQEWLILHGIGVRVDGDFGPATERAVKAFQEKTSRPPSGVVDQGTYEALTAPMRRVLAHIPGQKSFSELVIAYARQHLLEHPREVGGANRGPWVRLYMEGNEGEDFPWCAGFTSFIMQQAAETLKKEPPLKPTFSCDELAGRAQHSGLFLAGENLSIALPSLTPGCLFLCRKTPCDWTHVGIITRLHEDVIETIEGNTNDAGERDGYEVCRRMRRMSDKDFVCFQ